MRATSQSGQTFAAMAHCPLKRSYFGPLACAHRTRKTVSTTKKVYPQVISAKAPFSHQHDVPTPPSPTEAHQASCCLQDVKNISVLRHVTGSSQILTLEPPPLLSSSSEFHFHVSFHKKMIHVGPILNPKKGVSDTFDKKSGLPIWSMEHEHS